MDARKLKSRNRQARQCAKLARSIAAFYSAIARGKSQYTCDLILDLSKMDLAALGDAIASFTKYQERLNQID